MAKIRGHALHEYALGIGLIAVLSILALNFLGFSISDLMARNNDQTVSEADKLFNLVGASTGGATSGVGGGGKAVSVQIDPATGKVTFVSSGGSNVNTTSVDGMKGVANSIEALASAKTADGKPVPSDVQALLRELAALGESLADTVGIFEQQEAALAQLNLVIEQQMANGQYAGPPNYPQEAVLMSLELTEKMGMFQDVYNQLNAKLAADPSLSNIKSQVEVQAGVISQTAHHNMGQEVLGNFHIDRVDLATTMAAAMKYPESTATLGGLLSQTGGMSPAQKDAFMQEQAVALNKAKLVGSGIAQTGTLVSLR